MDISVLAQKGPRVTKTACVSLKWAGGTESCNYTTLWKLILPIQLAKGAKEIASFYYSPLHFLPQKKIQ